jgi:hypothetical protein
MFVGLQLQWPIIGQVVSTERWTTYSHACLIVPHNYWREFGFIFTCLPYSLITKYKFILCSTVHYLNTYIFLSQGCTNRGRLHCVRCRLIFVSPQCRTCFLSLFRRLEFWGDFLILGYSFQCFKYNYFYYLFVYVRLTQHTCNISTTEWNLSK